MQSPLPAPTATGSFGKTPYPHLLIYALERRLTGSFELTLEGSVVATIGMSGGFPSKVRLAEPIHQLGVVMNELEMITAEQLEASVATMQSASKLQGQTLVEMGAIDGAALEAGLRSQVERKLEHLFGMPPETAFSYYDAVDALASFGGEGTPIDPYPVLWRGVRSTPAWEHVDATLRRVGTAMMKVTATSQIERFSLLPQEVHAVEAMKQRPMRIVDVTGMLGPTIGQVLVYFLMLLKQVELVDTSQVPRSAAAMPPPSGQAFARVQLTKTTRSAPIREEVIARTKDDRTSSPVQQAAKPPMGVATPGISLQPMAAPAIVEPAIAEPPAAAPVPSEAEALSAEHAELKRKILERAEQINSQNYFEMLGLDRNATAEQVQKSFIALAKVWHPDRLPAALADVKDACSKVFTHITEANATLTDPAKRQEYITLVREGGATPDDQAMIQVILEAATNFQKAEHLLKRNIGDPQGYELVRKAVTQDPDQVNYIAMLAWLDAQKPECMPKERTLEKIAILDRCILKNKNCERAYFYRGMLYKRVNELQKAQKDFKVSSELNPRNLDAMREVRLYNMRTGATNPPPGATGRASKAPPAEKEKGGSLFGKLFKK